MNDGFAFFDIIIFAMLAGYLVFQLRRALGRRSDNQEPESKIKKLERLLSNATNVELYLRKIKQGQQN